MTDAASNPPADTPNADALSTDALLREALPELALSVAQTAALSGISVRQLGYWTRQGYMTAQGQGTRRTYGLDALRRALALRKAMDGGASLRQALRLIPQDAAREDAALETGTDSRADSAGGADGRTGDVARGLRGFFEFNPHARDHAGGLAVKLGRDEADVRRAAERLCRDGFLKQDVCAGMAIFRQADPAGPIPEVPRA